MLIVIGDDIGDYTLQGYKNGSCEKGNELDGVSAIVTSKERVLSDVLSEIIDHYFNEFDNEEELYIQDEMFLGAVSELFIQYGLLSDTSRQRYQTGMFEDIISDTWNIPRLFYLVFDVTIPAGASVDISATMYKEPSYDFAGSGSPNEGVQGYDMVTWLGSNLEFNKLIVKLISIEGVELINQNLGFDISDAITKVDLVPTTEHYFFEIRPIE